MRIRAYQILGFVMLAIILGELFIRCKSMTRNIKPVSNFEVEKYLGNWYEIARFDFMFEKNMSNVRANYSMNRDGTINVVNSGFDLSSSKMKTKFGRMKFAGDKGTGALKVSFFRPIYSEYNIIALDSQYRHAMVCGNSYDLLWILSRTPAISDDVKREYLSLAQELGFNTDKLVWTVQN